MAFVGTPLHLLLGQPDGALFVWDSTGQSAIERIWKWPGERIEQAVHTFSTDGRHVAYDDGKGVTHLWDVEGAEIDVTLAPVFAQGPMRLAVAPDGRLIAGMESAGSEEPWRTLALWDQSGRLLSRTLVDALIAPGVETRTYPKELIIGGPAPERSLALALGDGTVIMWDVSKPSRPQLLGAANFKIDAIAVSPIRPEIAIVNYEGAVSLWDPIGGQIEGLPGAVPGPKALAYSHDGRVLTAFALSDGTSRVVTWDLPSRQQRAAWMMYEKADDLASLVSEEIAHPEHAAIGPDGRLLALGNEGAVVSLWDLESHARITSLTLSSAEESLAFDADADRLMVAHASGVSHVDVSPRRLVARACEVAPRSLTPVEVQRYFDGATPPLSYQRVASPHANVRPNLPEN
jgi:WD40 repeat protein